MAVESLNSQEIKLCLFLARLRLRHESRRPRVVIVNGKDVQYEKVRELADLVEHLEEMQLAL